MAWTRAKTWTFLTADRLGRLATASSGGVPHVVPLWFEMQDDRILAYSRRSERKARNIAENPVFSLAVDDDSIPYRGVVLRGPAEVMEPEAFDPGPLIERLAVRFMGPEAGCEVGKRLAADPGAVTLALYPKAWASWDYSRHT